MCNTFQLVHYTACIQNSEIYISSYTSYIYIYTYLHVLFVYMYRIPVFFVFTFPDFPMFSNVEVCCRWSKLSSCCMAVCQRAWWIQRIQHRRTPRRPKERMERSPMCTLVFRGWRESEGKDFCRDFRRNIFRNQWWHQCWFFIRNLDSRMEMDGNGAY